MHQQDIQALDLLPVFSLDFISVLFLTETILNTLTAYYKLLCVHLSYSASLRKAFALLITPYSIIFNMNGKFT